MVLPNTGTTPEPVEAAASGLLLLDAGVGGNAHVPISSKALFASAPALPAARLLPDPQVEAAAAAAAAAAAVSFPGAAAASRPTQEAEWEEGADAPAPAAVPSAEGLRGCAHFALRQLI